MKRGTTVPEYEYSRFKNIPIYSFKIPYYMYVAINIWSRFSVKPTKSNQEYVFKDNNADLLRIKRVKKNALEYILGSIYTSN